MKILASTTSLTKAIEQALGAGVKDFKINSKHLTFSSSIAICIETKYRGDDDGYLGGFYVPVFTKLLEFLKLLQEQPIVIEFTEYNTVFHEIPEITLSQFEKSF